VATNRLLRKVNPLIRGWANYYRHGAAKRTFDRLDYYVYWRLWRWATRGHPNKSARCKGRKYFSAAGKRGLFSVRLTQGESPTPVFTLY
jgi:RNA-directed DNA polymerase